MIFWIGSKKNNRWAEAGRTGNLLKKISIFNRKSTERKGGRCNVLEEDLNFFPSALQSCLNILNQTNTVSNIRMKHISC